MESQHLELTWGLPSPEQFQNDWRIPIFILHARAHKIRMMKKEDKIRYLNKVIKEKDCFTYSGPTILYKYRPFDQFAFPMLEHGVLYLCPANKLDDETECMTSIDMSEWYDLETNNLKRVCLEQLIQMVKPYCSEEVYEEIRQIIYQVSYKNGKVRPNWLLDVIPDIQAKVPGYDIAPLFNWLVNIPEKLDDPSIKPQMEKLISLAMNAREKMGICSLCEDDNNEYMWEKYAAKNSGYCIEYDMDGYQLDQSVFPVIYEDDRKTNVVQNLVNNFIGQLVISFSGGQIQADISQYLRLFLTKYLKWEYQNEWRILGDPGEKTSPMIKRIIIGSNASEENKNKLIDFCKKNNVNYVIQKCNEELN